MPWTCKACNTEINEDDLVCPSCQAPKTDWTMVHDLTRTIRVSGRRIALLRGEDRAPGPLEEQVEDLVEARRAPVLQKKALSAVLSRGWAPAPRDVLTVRLFPKKHRDWTIELTIEFETEEADPRTFEVERPADFPPDGQHDVRFLLVYGPDDDLDGEPGELDVPGVDHVVDIGEEPDPADPDAVPYAPFIEVTALRKPPRRLPTGPDRYLINTRFFDSTGRVPVVDTDCTVGGRPGTTDGDGYLRLDDFEPGRHIAEFADGSLDIPASHHPSCVISVRLPFVTADEADLEGHPRQVRTFEPEEREGPPVWLPLAPDDEADEVEDEDAGEHELYDEVHGDVDDHGTSRYLINARFFDATGRVPVANADCQVAGLEGTTDEDGLLQLDDDVGPGRHPAVFAGGQVMVPASHHLECVVCVRLPFHHATEDEQERYPRQVRAREADGGEAGGGGDGPPRWLPLDPSEEDVDETDDDDEDGPDELFDEVHGDVDDLASLLE